MSKSISETLTEHVRNAIEAHGQGEDIAWEVHAQIGPEGNLIHVITLQGSSPILGQVLQAGGLMVNAKDVTGEEIASTIQSALEQIRQARTDALAEELPKPKQLVVPGLNPLV